MASYSDMAKDVEDQLFLEKWAPKGSYENLKPTVENLRFNIARANKAETQVKKYQKVLHELRELMEDR